MFGHYTTQAKEIGEAIKSEFGELDSRKLWLLVKLAKLARRSCRQNVAFNNAFGAAFPHATFRQVPKVSADGRSYLGLRIEVNGEVAEDSNGSDSERED